jgi:hypothetical protein
LSFGLPKSVDEFNEQTRGGEAGLLQADGKDSLKIPRTIGLALNG